MNKVSNYSTKEQMMKKSARISPKCFIPGNI